MTPSIRAIVLAAGKGTRMKSAKPKVLHEAAGRPLLGYVLDLCLGIEADTVVVVGHGAEEVRAVFPARPGLAFVHQEPQLGTGHAVQTALGAWTSDKNDLPVVVLAGDVPLLRADTVRALFDRHTLSGASATLVTFHAPVPGGYGRIRRNDTGAVVGIVEARDATPAELKIDEVNASIYVFDGRRLRETVGRLRAENAQGEYYLTDTIGMMAAGGYRVEALVLTDPVEASGVNTLMELAAVEREIYARRAAALVSAGVIIERPDTVLIGPDVRIDPGAHLRAFTIFEGASSVATGSSIGPFCRIENSTIGEGAAVLDSCLIRSSTVEAGASIGPFAHLRPDSVVCANAKVGNFVELKKTTLGKGSKAPHLSYLGDSTIGAGANIGAGTITCNYDGVVKSPTHIEDGAFVGSNSILVAPVRIGRGSYVAAGSVITKDVPEGSLAVGRARQENKPGWAARRPKKR